LRLSKQTVKNFQSERLQLQGLSFFVSSFFISSFFSSGEVFGAGLGISFGVFDGG
jgi:hypothetical protein